MIHAIIQSKALVRPEIYLKYVAYFMKFKKKRINNYRCEIMLW